MLGLVPRPHEALFISGKHKKSFAFNKGKPILKRLKRDS